MKYKNFVGIDISKLTLDLTLMSGSSFVMHRCIENEPEAITAFVKELLVLKGVTIGNTVFGMESTGIYSKKLVGVLRKKKAKLVIENPLHLKHSFGIVRGKTDKDDSGRIAMYLYKSRDNIKIFVERRDIIEQLAGLSTLRSRLVTLRASMATPLKENVGFIKKGLIMETNRLCSRSLTSISSDIKDIEESIEATWKSDTRLARLMEILLSVPSIGPVIALQVVISTNEFKTITTAKRFASYSGIAPFKYRSGTTVGKRTQVSHVANKRVKALIHTAAITAIRFVPDIRDYYHRKVTVEGKNRMSAANAVRFKIINRIFSCVGQDRLYEAEYCPKTRDHFAFTVSVSVEERNKCLE